MLILLENLHPRKPIREELPCKESDIVASRNDKPHSITILQIVEVNGQVAKSVHLANFIATERELPDSDFVRAIAKALVEGLRQFDFGYNPYRATQRVGSKYPPAEPVALEAVSRSKRLMLDLVY